MLFKESLVKHVQDSLCLIPELNVIFRQKLIRVNLSYEHERRYPVHRPWPGNQVQCPDLLCDLYMPCDLIMPWLEL